MCIPSKGLGDRLLLMPPSSTQSSPPPTLGSSSPGLPARVHLATGDAQRKVGALGMDACVVVVVVVVVVAVLDTS